ncbi:MAG: amidohydrolase [Pyramidobacter sp.]|nr:amidohydrolase [Pyramidobacter sp.]
MDLKKIYAEIDSLEPELIRTRRDFHKYAESAWTEFRTTSKVVQFLRGLGLEPKAGRAIVDPARAWAWPGEAEIERHMERAVAQGADRELVESLGGYTGAAVTIATGKPGPVIALRFDIDCNDVNECDAPDHRPTADGFASVNKNQMHACGHDGHATIGLAVAKELALHKDELCGTIKLIFQPGEEGDRGAAAVVGSGILDDADVVLAAHVYAAPEGKLGLAGSQMGLYATTKFDVTIMGKSAHAGAAPQEGNNAINAACLAVTGMQSFLQDGRGCSRLNVGTIHGGTGRNVIAEQCSLRMETRGSDTAVEQRLYKKALAAIEGACAAFDCTCESKIMGVCPTGDGDPDLAARIADCCASISDFDFTQAELPQTGGTDDFACMMEAVRAHGGKACYMGLLTPLKAGHHNSRFDFDERILKAGAKAFIAVVDMLMSEGVRA